MGSADLFSALCCIYMESTWHTSERLCSSQCLVYGSGTLPDITTSLNFPLHAFVWLKAEGPKPPAKKRRTMKEELVKRSTAKRLQCRTRTTLIQP